MKTLLVGLLTLGSITAFAGNARLIDKNGLLTALNSELKGKQVEEMFREGDEADLLVPQGIITKIKVKKANRRKIVMSGQSPLKIDVKTFKSFNNSMIQVLLNNMNTTVEVNGKRFENTYVVKSVDHVVYIFDNGERVNAYKVLVTSPDTGYSYFESGPAFRIELIVSSEVPGVAQILSLKLNGKNIYSVVSYQ